MSWENLREAYRTRLGNLTAKSVLVLMVDEANAEGLAFASVDRIATLTEINKRTTLRIIQVFGAIDLAERTEAMLKGKMRPAYQVNVSKLGMDLREPFRLSYHQAQSKGGCRRDTDAGVAETVKSVAETGRGVAETLPPHPLIGGPLLFPLRSPTPIAPASGGVRNHGSAIGDREKQKQEPATERAVDQVMSALAISNRRKRKQLRDVIALEATKGDALPTIALRMIDAWRKQAAVSHLLRVKFGIEKFYGMGYWKDENRWFWDEELLRRQREASVGSR